MNSTKRMISLLLSLLLVLSLLPGTALAAQTEAEDLISAELTEELAQESAEELDEEPTQEPAEEPTQEPAGEPTQELTQESSEDLTQESAQANTEEPTEVIAPSEEDIVEPETEAPEAEPEEEPSEEPQEVPTQEEDNQLALGKRVLVYQDRVYNLSYDDRITAEELEPGYSVLSIDTVRVDSKRVVKGEPSEKKDVAVLAQFKDENLLIACGTGIATVLLVPTELLEDARQALDGTGVPGSDQSIPCIRYKITVKPAKLTLFFLAGQSNIEGMCSGGGYQDSVACAPGTVYSTYVPYVTNAQRWTGVPLQSLTSSTNWDKSLAAYLPESLTATTSLAGKKLTYPLNALTSDGLGKAGPDGAMGYEWYRLSGEKVWVVNASWSGSSVKQWLPGEVCCKRAVATFSGALQILKAERAVGHYTIERQLMFWLQGESDNKMTTSQYADNFRKVCDHFRTKCGVQHTGIISVRAAVGNHRGERDLTLTAPRIAQYAIAANSKDTRIYMVSNENEKWISDKGVKAYFAAAYPEGRLTYPMHRTGGDALPTTERSVHGAIHYSQIGHNENGLTAARGMYNLLQGQTRPESVSWINAAGKHPAELNLPEGSGTAVMQVSPAYAAKQVRFKNNSSVNYNSAQGKVTVKNGFGTLQTTYGGKAFAALTVSQLTTPGSIKTTNVNAGVEVKWKAVKGAKAYRVFYRVGTNGKWRTAGDTEQTTFVVKKLTGGTAYSFTVRCLSKRGGTFTSGMNNTGVSTTFVAAPALRNVAVNNGVATLRWSKSAGAEKYRVFYRKAGEKKWRSVGSTSQTTMELSTLAEGSYFFTVRCLSANGKTYISGFNETGKAFRITR